MMATDAMAMVDAAPHSHHSAAHQIDYSHSHSHSHLRDGAHQPVKSHIHSRHATHTLHASEQQHNSHAQQNGHSDASGGLEAAEDEVTSPASTSSSSSAASTLSSSSTASSTSPPHPADAHSPPLSSSPPPLSSDDRTSAGADELLTAEDVEEVLEATSEGADGLEGDDEAQVKRVKVYQLNDVGQWDDKGTGQVSVLHPHTAAMCIEVKAERGDGGDVQPAVQPGTADASEALSSLVLLHHRLVDGQDYQRQGDTIITWCENSTGLDLALSFQDTDGCTAIWQLVTQLQNSSDGAELTAPDRHSLGTEEEVSLSLPAVSVEALDEVVAKTTVTSAAQKDYMAAALMRGGSGADSGAYMAQLFALHRRCDEAYERSGEEDEERRRQLRHLELLFAVARNLFLLNDANVIEWLVADERFMQTTALLEYDPAYSATPSTFASLSISPSAPATSNSPAPLPAPLPAHDYHHHRSFLSSSCFLTFPSLSADPTLPSKVRQSYNLTYVRDVLLLRHLDDAALSTLSSMLFLNSVSLISRMNERREWMGEVMELMHRAMAPQPATSLSASPDTSSAPVTTTAASSPSSADSSAASSPLSTPSTLSSLSSVSPTYISPLLLAPSPSSPSPSASHVVSPATHSLALIRRHIFAFLQELLVLAKSVQAPLRDAFYRGLCEAGLLGVVEEAMRRVWAEEEDERRRWEGARGRRRRRAGEWEAVKEREIAERRSMWVWITCTDMLTSLLMHDANIVRNHILPPAAANATPSPSAASAASSSASPSPAPSSVSPPPASPLLSTIFSPLCSSALYLGMGHQLSCILRLLLDPNAESLDEDAASTPFFDHIYAAHMPSLLVCLTAQPVSPACYHVTELLSFCVLHHGWLFPAWCARVQLFERLYRLMEQLSLQHGRASSKGRMELVCSVIRLLRTCMATREVYYQQQLIADFSGGRPQCSARSLLSQLFVLFHANERYNLLNSSLIDLFLLVKADRLVVVMDAMVEAEGERLERVSYVSVFAGLRQEWAATKLAMAREREEEDDKARREAERQQQHGGGGQHKRRNHSAASSSDGDDEEDEEDEDGLNGGEALDDEAEDGSKSPAPGDADDAAAEDERNGESDAMEGWEKGVAEAAPVLTSRRDDVRARKRKSSGLDDTTIVYSPAPSATSPAAHHTTITVSSPPASSNASPLSIVITKSPTFSASPSSPPLSFSLARVNSGHGAHLPYGSNSPGSPPLAPSPTSPRSPNSLIHRARSPPPPGMGSPVRFTKSLGGGSGGGGGGGGGEARDVGMEVEAAVSGASDEVDVKRRKTASF